MIRCKRAYEEPSAQDGQRVLVDRLWPRNRRKEELRLEDWCKEVAPSSDLRRDFKGGLLDFEAFRTRYRKELAAHPEHWKPLLERAGKKRLTLVYAARDEQQNNARVLAEWLEEQMQGRSISESED